jgi:hypothetical protein
VRLPVEERAVQIERDEADRSHPGNKHEPQQSVNTRIVYEIGDFA